MEFRIHSSHIHAYCMQLFAVFEHAIHLGYIACVEVERSNSDTALPENMNDILETFEVLMPDKSICFNDEQFMNIELIFFTLSV